MTAQQWQAVLIMAAVVALTLAVLGLCHAATLAAVRDGWES